MDSNNPPPQREIVYCHGCENEWYRDEHGLTCPECQSDFVEVVEAGSDPREDEQHIPADPQHPGDLHAPDPDEDDIDNLHWEETGPGRYRVRGRYTTDIPLGQAQQAQQQPGGLMGMVGGLLQGMLAGPSQGQQPGQQEGQYPPSRPASAPGSPPPEGQPRGNGTFIRQGGGPGFSYTIASSSSNNFGSGLFPRNANGPQPRQNQPEQIEQMLNQMMMNIGVAPPGMRAGPGGHPYHDHDMHPGFGGPFMMGGGGSPGQQPGAFGPLGNIFQLFGGGANGQMGDAVFTQEALDRVVTQLMEQHQAGNAPGPASAEAIQSLPTREITEKDQGENGKAECSICMDEVELGGKVTALPCAHWFHFDCVKAWLGEHDTCPHCRQGIMPKESEGQQSNQPRSSNQAPLHDMHSPQFTRPAGPPGGYPFPPAQNAGGGQGASGGAGVFGRMRDAFGRGAGGSSSGGTGTGGAGGEGEARTG